MRTDPSRAAHPEWIVVDDPEREFSEGHVVNASVNHVLESRGGATLPVSPGLVRRGGVAGYMRRGFGAGLYLTEQPKMLSCCALFSTKGALILHWRARLLPTPETKSKLVAGQLLDGSLRMTSDSSQGGHVATVATHAAGVHARQLGSIDGRGGWTIGGEAPTQFAIDGFYGMALFGTIAGVRVAWAAASLTER